MSDTVKTSPCVGAQQTTECPEGCCQGNEILCISIPCPITIVLLGLTLTLNLPCLSLTSQQPLQVSQVQETLGVLATLLGNLLSGVTTKAAANEVKE